MASWRNIPRQERAIQCLLASSTIAQAAQAANVAERTLHRWLTEPNFRAMLDRARRDAFRRATDRLAAIAHEAAETLYDVMRDNEAPPAVRVNAAKTILELGRDSIELDDMGERLAALEAAVSGRPTTAGVPHNGYPGTAGTGGASHSVRRGHCGAE